MSNQTNNQQNRNHFVKFRMNDKEYAHLKDRAATSGTTASDLIRDLVKRGDLGESTEDKNLRLMNTLTDVQIKIEKLIRLLQANDPGSEETMTELLERYLYLEEVVLDNLNEQ